VLGTNKTWHGEINLAHLAEFVTTARRQKLPIKHLLETKIFILLPDFQQICARAFESVFSKTSIYIELMVNCIHRKPETGNRELNYSVIFASR
jgi:hypothetical protein